MGMTQYKTPGVYREDVFPPPEIGLLTGVPAFIGYATQGPVDAEQQPTPQVLTLSPQFTQYFGVPQTNSYLSDVVRGFFANGGGLCYVLRLRENVDALPALNQALERLESLESIDLVCAPDIMRPLQAGAPPVASDAQQMQLALLNHCERLGNRIALLDALPNLTTGEIVTQRQGLRSGGLSGINSALYYPWVWIPDANADVGRKKIPPCGHIAGVYARSDQRIGVHKAPANEVLAEVLDVEVTLSDAQQGDLNPENINCIRSFPGRGIRIWGARTLSTDPAWTYVNVRRLFITAGRWIERTLAGVAFEPNDFLLWVRIERELRAYFGQLFRQGALKGGTEEDAFYVQCDAETNPPEVQDAGIVVTEIGLAPAIPSEFVVVRLIHGASGVTITGPSPA